MTAFTALAENNTAVAVALGISVAFLTYQALSFFFAD